ncbi:MAG TPA: hypothetical protein VEY11_18980 [Pyrinomonadaceae bacterium]|nr:hypothetical protein [Pyrinomonadaceae bacterium]
MTILLKNSIAWGSIMAVTAILFGILIFSVSLFFVLAYIQGQSSMRQNRNSQARQREQQLKLQADLQARIEADARRFEEARRALLERAGRHTGSADREQAA